MVVLLFKTGSPGRTLAYMKRRQIYTSIAYIVVS